LCFAVAPAKRFGDIAHDMGEEVSEANGRLGIHEQGALRGVRQRLVNISNNSGASTDCASRRKPEAVHFPVAHVTAGTGTGHESAMAGLASQSDKGLVS
jgi:hypothetical protein